MFLVLVRARLRMAWNSVRTCPPWRRLVFALFGMVALALVVGIAAVSAALVMLAQNGVPMAYGLTPAAVALVDRMEEYLFFLLLAGSVPFVAATLFQSDDLPLLLVSPASPRAIMAAKLLEAYLVNAGQFVVLGIPVMIGVGVAAQVSFLGWLALLLTIVLLLVLPPSVTALMLLLAARALGMRRVRVTVTLISVLLGLFVTALAVVGAGNAVKSGSLDMARLQAALRGYPTGASEIRLPTDRTPGWLPSTWAAESVRELAGGRPLEASGAEGLLALAASSALLVGLCIVSGAPVLVSDAFLEQTAPRSARQRRGKRSVVRGWGAPIVGLFVKDQKYMLRDVILLGQIGTALILFLVPFLLRAVERNLAASDSDLFGYLALSMVGLVVYMVTSILSLSSVGLEGSAFWVVLGSPISRGTFLRAKWLWSFTISLAISTVLILICGPAFRLGYHTVLDAWLLTVAACFALTGLGVGLAGLFPRFVYENPAHRASIWALILGFVLSGTYMVVTGLIAGVGYVLVARGIVDPASAVTGGISVFCLFSLITGSLPVALAARRLKRYAWEF